MPRARNRLRQDATSCELCRRRKLKCDRQRPSCANCHSRGITCTYRLKSADDASPARSTPLPHELRRQQDDAPLWYPDVVAENRALAARLRRLEEYVRARDQTTEAGTDQHHVPLTTYVLAPAPAITATPLDNATDEDSKWLEMVERRSDEMVRVNFPLSQIGMPRLGLTLSSPRDQVMVQKRHRVGMLTRVAQIDSLIVHIGTLEQSASTESSLCPSRRITLPPHEVVTACLDLYAEYLDGVQHIMHVEDTRRLIDRVYMQAQLHPRQRIDPGAIALVLSMCAIVAFHWIAGFRGSPVLFDDHATALNASTEWARQSLIAMEQVRNGSSATLQAIQASAILIFLFYHMDGLTYRVRMMLATSITMAKDLKLHRIDAPGIQSEVHSPISVVETEVKRRIWWYLTSTDWHLSIVGGPQEGLYIIRPQQMNVSLPRNIDWDDLDGGNPDFERSLDDPTAMSYYLQRVKLSVTCREVADALYGFSAPDSPSYDIVKTLDSKFQQQLEELPRFLHFDLSNRQLKAEYGTRYTRQTNIQGMMINVIIHIRRCKLHLPYLIRARANPDFAFSRHTCLQAARSVFNVRRIMLSDSESASAAHLRLGGMLRHIFFATVVLVMDLCINQQQHKDNRSQVAEAREALEIIEEGKQASPVGALFLDSLMTVLRKHHVRLPNMDQARNADLRAAAPLVSTMAFSTPDVLSHDQTSGNFAGSIYSQTEATEMPSGPTGGIGDVDIISDNELWQDFIEQGPMLGGEEWNALIDDLDMHLA